PRRDTEPDFIESIARGFDVVKAFDAKRPVMTLSEVSTVTQLARPTVRRILRTLEALGYVRPVDGGYALTPRVLELGLTYVQGMGLWDVARPHMERLVSRTHESTSIGQLDGSDIVYVARVAVPKLIALAVQIGTRFPAPPTSLGKVLLAGLGSDELDRVLAEPSRAGVEARWRPDRAELDIELREVRARGWALTDEQLASGIRSIAAPVRDGSGRVVAAMNVTVHAAETSVRTLTEDHLPLLLQTASAVSADFARYDALPKATVNPNVPARSGAASGLDTTDGGERLGAAPHLVRP
ncbi:MAG: IclR family transcriptional regulator domain-containing protein, partial [Actinomycetes bacterium]